ncbi:hypothetical protein V8C34DRAFT_102878 [Trichoderma compactum]
MSLVDIRSSAPRTWTGFVHLFFCISFYVTQRPGYQGLGVPYENWDVMEEGGLGAGSALRAFGKGVDFCLCIQGRLGGAFYTYITGGNSIMDRSLFHYFLHLSFSFSLSFPFLYLSVVPLRISDMYNYLHCMATGSANAALLVHAC